jgi:2-polyprenyl-3-methyl-5-hydroxy-6-metoxy-1,4-benzoquinol methylase
VVGAATRETITERVARFYDELPFNFLGSRDSAELIRTTNQIEAYADLDAVLRSRSEQTVLDVGCGAGWFVNTCARHYGLRTHGIDLSTTALERARETSRILDLGDVVSFEHASLFEFDPGETFDVVNSIGVLHHTHSVPEALAAITPHVADDGVLHVGLYHLYGRAPFLAMFERYRGEDVTEEDLDEALALYAELQPQSDPEFLRSWFRDQVIHPHETQHTLEEMHEVLGALGFRIVSTSINRFEPFEDIRPLFELEKTYEDVSRKRNVEQRRYFPGFFTFLARRAGA